MRNETNKMNKYTDAWETFIARNDEDTAQSRRDLRVMNNKRGGAPKISTIPSILPERTYSYPNIPHKSID